MDVSNLKFLISTIWIIGFVCLEYDNECLLPNRQKGHCIPIKSCRKTYELLNEAVNNNGGKLTNAQRDELLALQCGSMNNSVSI